MGKQADDKLKLMDEQGKSLTKEHSALNRIVEKASDDIDDCNRAVKRASGHERVVRSGVDVVKKTEVQIKQQYRRSIFATSVCRQITMLALKTLESTLRLLQSIHSSAVTGKVEHAADMADVNLSGGCAPGSSTSHGTSADLKEKIITVLESVRNLMLDLDDIDRTVTVLDDVSLLDEAIKAASDDPHVFTSQYEKTVLLRKEVEHNVRASMPFDRVTYSTLVNYEAHVVAEVSKRMKATEVN